MNTDNETALISAIQRHGLAISREDIPEVLQLGADAYLHRRGVDIPEKQMLELYLIINDMRDSGPSGTSNNNVQNGKK